MILAPQAIVEYVGISASQLAQAIGRSIDGAGRFVGDHKLLTAVVVIGLLLLLFGRRSRA